MKEVILDARGLQCPGPIVQLFKAVKCADPGDVVIVEATDPGFKKDVTAWCCKTDNELVALEEADGVIRAKVRKAR